MCFLDFVFIKINYTFFYIRYTLSKAFFESSESFILSLQSFFLSCHILEILYLLTFIDSLFFVLFCFSLNFLVLP